MRSTVPLYSASASGERECLVSPSTHNETGQVGARTFLGGPESGGGRVEGTVVVGFAKETLDGEEDGGDVVHGRPLVLEDVEADVAVLIDVGVEARRLESNHGRGERVAAGEAEGQLVGLPSVGRALHPNDRSSPRQEVAPFRER